MLHKSLWHQFFFSCLCIYKFRIVQDRPISWPAGREFHSSDRIKILAPSRRWNNTLLPQTLILVRICRCLEFYYIQFEIIGYTCNVIGSQRCDLFPNRTIFCSKSHLFSRPMRMAQKNQTTNQISRLFFKLTNHITGKWKTKVIV